MEHSSLLVLKGEPKQIHPRHPCNPREPLSPILNPPPVPVDISDPRSVPPLARSGSWVLRAEGGGAEHFLTAGSAPVWVGRWQERVGIWLDDGGRPSKASRLHARLEYSAISGLWEVVDNESANGTYVNAERVPPNGRLEIREGDRVGFGSVPTASSFAAAEDHGEAMPRFHFVVRLQRAIAARELANAPEIDFTAPPPPAPLPPPAKPPGSPPAASAAAPAAFEAGERETLLSLLGCMRSQLRSATSALHTATTYATHHAERDAVPRRCSAHEAMLHSPGLR